MRECSEEVGLWWVALLSGTALGSALVTPGGERESTGVIFTEENSSANFRARFGMLPVISRKEVSAWALSLIRDSELSSFIILNAPWSEIPSC